ncbi:MAG TPA: MFS transporter [Steroidobacteraceae bacterium]|nr:MFS transporter [Steroidobacteraceae bacterium]
MNQAVSAHPAHSAFSAFRHRAFTVLWTATVVSNLGGWMYSAASAWLMTTLDPNPVAVSLVQVATSLPTFLFALLAGALADIVDKRRLLIVVESFITVSSTALAALVWLDLVTPGRLLFLTFLVETGAALTAPAWQSIVPQLVPRQDLPEAVAANSVGVNVSRAVGPALGGVITVAWGIAAPFWANAGSNLGSIGGLLWWRAPQTGQRRLPTERVVSALQTGIRYARHSRHLRATLWRAVAFFLFASAYWALLPLVARDRIAAGPKLYGILLGVIGASAIAGAFALPRLKKELGPDRLVAAGTIGTAGALLLFGLARNPATAIAASVLAGISWIAVLSSLNVSAQFALPEWVRGRGLAMYMTVFFGATTLGSAIWGEVASMAGLPAAHFVAAAGALLAIPLTWRWKLQTAQGMDLTPSMSWPAPIVTGHVGNDQGPVMVTVEYRISPKDREAFLTALERLSHERRRDGAYAWGIFEDIADRSRFLETFFVESWLEHLRQHERVTNADRMLQDHIHRLVQGTPKITHLIAAEPVGENAAPRSA